MFTKKFSHKKTILGWIGGIGAVGITAFIGHNLYPIIHGPTITLETITDGQVLTSPAITLSGKARFAKDLAINGVPMFFSTEGVFNKDIVLAPGYNTLIVSGTDRYGKNQVKEYSLVLEEPVTPLAVATTTPE